MTQIIKRYSNVTNGTEGPGHDPYSYTEYRLVTELSDGFIADILIHYGLEDYFTVNDSSRIHLEGTPEAVSANIERIIRSIVKSQERRRARCACGSRRIAGHYGFPGEYLYACKDCGAIVDSEFDLSAVI